MREELGGEPSCCFGALSCAAASNSISFIRCLLFEFVFLDYESDCGWEEDSRLYGVGSGSRTLPAFPRLILIGTGPVVDP